MECGECTACCTAFPVKRLGKEAFTDCKHCDKGCNIQDTKPDECRNFNCAYIQSKIDDINLRPDKCGVIFEKVDNENFFCTMVRGVEITALAQGQMDSFVKQGYTVRVGV